MKLLSFSAKKVHDYMDFDIDFNKDVNFLIGSNGSGKTTAIKMIKALLSPSLKDLVSISFESCKLTIERYGKSKSIEIVRTSKKSNEFTASYDGEHHTFIFPEHLQIDVIEYNVERNENLLMELDALSDNPVFNKIRRLPTPIFLGVDRKNGNGNMFPQRVYREAFISPSHQRNIVKGLLGNALIETQLMIQDSYKGIRNLEEKQGGVLRDSILRSSFKFSSFNPEDLTVQDKKWMQANQLINKKAEINRALRKITNVDDSLSNELDSFFDSLEKLLYELRTSGDDAGFSLNWLMNQAQIKRISDLVDVIDSYDRKIQDIYKPVNEFASTINKFFIDSDKRISIDPVGRILVHINNRKQIYSVDCLSSGERQLLIIIANVLFNKYRNSLSPKISVIIIDEPELSLHMRWQEMFSEIILETSPETQFILATHSPDIVGDLTDKCKKVRKVIKKDVE
ncbi:ATP-binding protein [Vibrio vulnificus]|nr:AAA family ATPase [Vibrio vulnificus]MCU8165081.1 ATP-binding protein [Vibrio vulnificus]MCU8169794.1 ATP-binding protein [Vibrio vulnificus]